jgi:hypothetical protein
MPPTFPDLRAIDTAILAILTNDAILAALMPGGVHWDTASFGLTAFVVVSQQDHVVADVFGADDSGTELVGYLVKAVHRSSAADPALDAAARIHDLLQRQPLTLTDSGYELMLMQRTRRVRYAEFDVTNAEWQHVGGVYNVLVSRGAVATP